MLCNSDYSPITVLLSYFIVLFYNFAKNLQRNKLYYVSPDQRFIKKIHLFVIAPHP